MGEESADAFPFLRLKYSIPHPPVSFDSLSAVLPPSFCPLAGDNVRIQVRTVGDLAVFQGAGHRANAKSKCVSPCVVGIWLAWLLVLACLDFGLCFFFGCLALSLVLGLGF